MKSTWEIIWFVAIFVLAIYLIEYQATNFLAETAGDLFGATALILVGVFVALKD